MNLILLLRQYVNSSSEGKKKRERNPEREKEKKRSERNLAISNILLSYILS